MVVVDRSDALHDLRLRLYRPDPPPGAVEAYLAAVDRAERDAPTPVPRHERSPRVPWRERVRRAPRIPARQVAAALLVGAALAGGFAALPLATRAQPGAAAVVAPPPPAPDRYPPVPGVQLGVLAGRGPDAADFDAQGHLAIVSVRCAGTGTIVLRLGDEAPTVLACEARGTGLAMFESGGAVDRFTLRVAPTAGVRWTLAVGAVPAG